MEEGSLGNKYLVMTVYVPALCTMYKVVRGCTCLHMFMTAPIQCTLYAGGHVWWPLVDRAAAAAGGQPKSLKLVLKVVLLWS